MKDDKLRKQLKFWFTVHFVVDVVSALLLFTAPKIVLGFAGWQEVDPIATRLVAAALFGIGIESLIGRSSSLESFRTMLRLKVIWSFFAVTGIAVSLIVGQGIRPAGAFAVLAVFLAFHILWLRFYIKVRSTDAY